ncbi:MAG: hypothetical protein ACPGVK_01335 [Halocynthiibacter sp.]
MVDKSKRNFKFTPLIAAVFFVSAAFPTAVFAYDICWKKGSDGQNVYDQVCANQQSAAQSQRLRRENNNYTNPLNSLDPSLNPYVKRPTYSQPRPVKRRKRKRVAPRVLRGTN